MRRQLNFKGADCFHFENNYLTMIEKVVAAGESLIIRTGMVSFSELDNAVRTCEKQASMFTLNEATSVLDANTKLL